MHFPILLQHDISLFEKEGRYSLRLDDESLNWTLSEVEITSEDIPGWTVAVKAPLTVALGYQCYTGIDAGRQCQRICKPDSKNSKRQGFEVTDRIEVKVAANNGINQSLAKFNDYICAEILADKLELTCQN